MLLGRLFCLVVQITIVLSQQSIQPSTFTALGAFPTSVYTKYFNSPTATSAQVQPVISDPVLHKVFPFSLTDPNHIPINNTVDPHPLPPVASAATLLANAVTQIKSLSSNPTFSNNTCALCQAILEIGKFVALAAPDKGPEFFVEFCTIAKLSTTCNATFGLDGGIGSVLTQVVANADIGGADGQALCQNTFQSCTIPPTAPLDLTGWFAKPKPSPLPPPKKPSGKRLNVLHLSDFHLDPRYATGAEANCTTGLCCRAGGFNKNSPNTLLSPAPRFGAYLCDTPYALALAALEAIPALTGTKDTGFAWTIYTGDLVSHDPDNQLSRSYIEYTETVVYDLFRKMLGSGPVYPALGNHDSYNQAQDAPHSLGGALTDQFSWNYDHVAGLWQHEQWLPETAVQLARSHYAAYMVKRADGLRIITLNTDFWYHANLFTYVNITNPDISGMLRFVTDELQDAEDAGDRVWIIGHVLTGWDGTNGLRNPTNLFYQIVDRYSPHVIANIFFGHTHEDELSIFYSNNASVIAADTALTTSWMGPSITPLTNLNSGFRVYEVDSATFDILDAHTWKSDVNSFPSLDPQIQFGPTFAYEYNTRETYGQNVTGWGPNDPLNATWWHHVTEAMEADPSLVTTFNTFQGKGSILTPPCVGDCITAKICYMRSGSVPIATGNCIPGFDYNPPSMTRILAAELWLEIFEWATYNPLLNIAQSNSPFQPVPLYDNIRDLNLNVRLTISLVCRQWRLWAARSLYSDIKIKDPNGASSLRKALERPTIDGHYGEMVRRVVLQYNSTIPGPSNQPMPSIEILKLCPHIHTLLRPRFSHTDGLHFDYEAAGVPLPVLQRLEWWHHNEAERSGGINSLGAVLHSAPNLSYLFVGGVVRFSRICMQKETFHLPQLQTLRLNAINGLLLHQIVSRWFLPSLTHIVLDSPPTDPGWALIWDAFGRQLKVIEFGKHLRYFSEDRLSPCLNGCPGLEELNFYLCFTAPPETLQPHTSLTTVRLHAAINYLLPDSAAVWDLIDRHFEVLCGTSLSALRHIMLYGGWQPILHHPRFISIQDKLLNIGRVLEVSD